MQFELTYNKVHLDSENMTVLEFRKYIDKLVKRKSDEKDSYEKSLKNRK